MSNAPIFCNADNVEQFYEFVKDDNSGGSEGVLAPPPPVPSNFYPDILHRLMMTTSVCPQLQESIWNGGGWQLHAGGYVNTAEDPYINGYCPPGGLLPFYQEQAQVNSTSNNICPVKSENEDESFKQLREFIINRRKRLLALDHNEQANTSASAQPAQYQHAQLRTAQRFDWAEDVENSERNARQQSTDSSGSEGIFYHRLSPSDATWGMDKSKYIRNYQHDEDEQKNAATNRKTPTPTTKGKINDSDDRKMRANAREQRLRKDKRNTGGYRMAKSAILDAIKTNKKSTTPPIKTSHENLEQNMLKNSSPSTKEKYDSDPQETAFASDRFPICTQDDFYSPDDKFWDDDSHTDESDTKTGTIPLFDAASYKLSPTTTEEKFSDEYSIIDESNPQRSSPYVESRVYNKSEPCTEDTSLEEESSYPQTRQSPFIDEAESFVKTQPHPQITKTPFVEARSSKMPQLAIDENFWYRYMTTRSSSYTESRSYEESQLDTEEKSLEEVIQPHSGNSSFTETGSFINIEPCTQEDSYPQTTQSPCIEATSSKMSQSAADKKSWDSYSSTYESDPQRSSSYVEPRSFKKSPPHTEETILEEESYPQTTKTQFVQANRRSQPYAEEKSLEEESHPPTRKPATFKKFQSFPKTQSSSDGKYKTASSTRHSSTSSDGSIEEDAVSFAFFTCELFLQHCVFFLFCRNHCIRAISC